MNKEPNIPFNTSPNRRKFLSMAMKGLLSLPIVLKPLQSLFAADAPSSSLLPLKTLGRTGLKVSAVGLGTGGITPASVIKKALDSGINIIDTAAIYGNGAAETEIGTCTGTHRNRMILATKFSEHLNHANATVADYKTSFHESLQRMKTNYVDIVFLHNAQSHLDILNPALLQAFDELKQEGNVHFLGVSSHHHTMMAIMETAILSGYYDVILCRYLLFDYKSQEPLFQLAHQNQVGVMVMKVLASALQDHTNQDHQIPRESAIRTIITNPMIHSALFSIGSFQQLSGIKKAWMVKNINDPTIHENDSVRLAQFKATYAHELCTYCGICVQHCPSAMPIPDIFRFRNYDRYYHRNEMARDLYQQALRTNTLPCATCHAGCESTCPKAIPIRNHIIHTHSRLG